MPLPVANAYVKARYKKRRFCDYPFSTRRDEDASLDLPIVASQLDGALSLWHFPLHQRQKWLSLVGSADGAELSRNLRNIDEVEVENGIVKNMSKCTDMMSGRPLRIIGWNAQRGKNWLEFAKLIHGMDADLVLLNEMGKLLEI